MLLYAFALLFSFGVALRSEALHRYSHRSPSASIGWRRGVGPLFADIRIRIQGTKNAYTTLRPNDVVLYELEKPLANGKVQTLGVLNNQGEILPLCNHVEGGSEFFVDNTVEKLDAETLKRQEKLLRVISSDRRGQDCFLIEEYMDSDIWIPVKDPNAKIPVPGPFPVISGGSASLVNNVASSVISAFTSSSSSSPASNIPLDVPSLSSIGDLDEAIALTDAKLQVATLQAQLMQLKSMKQKAEASGTKATLTAVTSKLVPAAVGPYSHAVISNGFVFVSGCISLNQETGRIAMGGVEAETRQALINLKNILKESGSDITRVCKTTVMIRDLAAFPLVNKVYAEYFTGEVLPARSTLEVSFLPMGAAIEIDAIAVI